MASVPGSPVAPPGAPPQPPDAEPQAPPQWPLWAPFVALAAGIAGGFIVLGTIAAIVQAAGVNLEEESPGFTAAGTFVLDVAIVAAVVVVAARTARPALWQFGFRRGPLGFSIGMAFMAVLAFFIFELGYVKLFDPENPQTVAEDLGADRNKLLLVLGALVVIVVAPVCEELFFRGFLFPLLRARLGFLAAAVIDGVLFGLVHGSLVILPVLAFLGVALCWVYMRTGTLFAPIAIHALNNMIAYGAVTDDGWGVALGTGALMLMACASVPALLPRRTPSPV